MEGHKVPWRDKLSPASPVSAKLTHTVGSQIDLHILCKSCVRTLSDQSECCNSARNDELAALFSFNQSPKVARMYKTRGPISTFKVYSHEPDTEREGKVTLGKTPSLKKD